ncbi:MAG: hypothetical protein J0I06_05805 [Planctomycetes bacterium]|nr:hypothetical protein [Planctomycetota bacterium]
MRHLLTALVALAVPAVASAQGFVESASPPVIERGKTARVAFVGKDLGPGLDVWHALPKGALRAKPVSSEPGKLVFDITASADAPVGVCGLRVATRDGLTNAVLFHVEDLPVRGKIAGDKPVPLERPACVWGTFREGTLDRYTVAVAANERVSFECVSNRLGKDADPLLTVRDADGRFVTERDNDAGLYFDFRFEHTFEKAGTYTLEVRDARLRASEHHHYALRVGRFPTERVAVPSAVSAPDRPSGAFFRQVKRPGDDGSSWLPVTIAEGHVTVAKDFDAARDTALSQATSGPTWYAFRASPMRGNPFLALERSLEFGSLQPTPAKVPGVLCGVLKQPGRRQCFAVQLEKGQRIFLRAEAKSLNSPAELELTVFDRTGREQRRGQEGRDGDITLDFTAPSAGVYGVAVRDTLRDGSEAHAYRVTVRDKPFPPSITAEVEGLTVPRGNYQVVPLVVARNGGTGPIKLSLAGAPSGLQLTPDTIAETESAIVCKLEADASTAIGVHTVRIVAECGGEKFLVRTRPLIDKRYQNVDLIPIALREDQTRPPPSLADRFAVQVAPPSPFTFELPEKTITLPRYQSAPIPVVTTRTADFDGPITFHATGGQLADKNEGRTRVYAEFPDATVKRPNVSGAVVSKILSNIGKVRVEVTATGTHADRRVTLIRTFELDLTHAYKITADTPKVALLPGESARVKLAVERLKSFDGPVALHLNTVQGLEAPGTVTVPRGRASVEFEVKATADAQPRKQNWQLTATADVSGFEEELRAAPVEIEFKKVEVPKKK